MKDFDHTPSRLSGVLFGRLSGKKERGGPPRGRQPRASRGEERRRYVVSWMNCALWTTYAAITPGRLQPFVTNAGGGVLEAIYCGIFLRYAAEGPRRSCLKAVLLRATERAFQWSFNSRGEGARVSRPPSTVSFRTLFLLPRFWRLSRASRASTDSPSPWRTSCTSPSSRETRGPRPSSASSRPSSTQQCTRLPSTSRASSSKPKASSSCLSGSPSAPAPAPSVGRPTRSSSETPRSSSRTSSATQTAGPQWRPWSRVALLSTSREGFQRSRSKIYACTFRELDER